MLITKNWRRLISKVSTGTLKYAILIIAAIVLIFPFYVTFIMAITGWGGAAIQIGPIILWPKNPMWQNFIYAWSYGTTPPLWRAFLNSTIVTVSAMLLSLFFSSLTAFALAIYKFRGGGTIFRLVLSTMLIPSFIGLIPGYMLMYWLGLLNTYWALIIPGVVSAYSVFLLRQYMITIPDELIESARMDGCSEFGLYWRIILPLSKPIIIPVGMVNAIWTWNDFLWPLMVLLRDRNLWTIPLALSDIYGAQGGIIGPLGSLGAAQVILSILPLAILWIVAQKYIMRGWTLGYVKK